MKIGLIIHRSFPATFFFFVFLLPGFSQITPKEAVPLMQKGINLGNTLEPPYEGGWNNPPAESYYFDMYKEAGFQCVRIPVRWDKHTQTDPPYRIDESWMNRVEQVVDWGLDRGLFIILNAHHDNWIKSNYNDPSYRARFDSIWSQIAVRFKDKSDRLFFEILNEPHGLTKAQNDELHRRELSIIRKTNPTRIVIFQGNEWGGSDQLLEAAVPDDEYVMGSFHSYDPYWFGIQGEGTWGSPADYNRLKNKFIAVKTWSDTTNIPVFLGEFGAVKSCDYNSRMLHYRAYVELSRIYGFVYCAWDDGGKFRIMEREQHKWDEVKDILLHTTYYSPANLKLDIYQDTVLQLTWTNRVPDNDSIYIERRTSSTFYERVATFKGDTAGFLDYGLKQEQNYYYRIIAHYNDTVDLYSQPIKVFLPKFVPKERSCFYGTPLQIPGVIEAEDFDKGGEGLTYHDENEQNLGGAYRPEEAVDIYDRLGNGYHIGNALPGEWCEYTVNVQYKGNYTVKVYLASPYAGGTSILKVGDVLSDTIHALNTNSWLDTKPVIFNMVLDTGVQVMRYSILEGPMFNIDRFEFTLVPSAFFAPSFRGRSDRVKVSYYPEGISVSMESGMPLEKMTLFSVGGTLISLHRKKVNNYWIPASQIPPGFYILKVFSQNIPYSSKIVFH